MLCVVSDTRRKIVVSTSKKFTSLLHPSPKDNWSVKMSLTRKGLRKQRQKSRSNSHCAWNEYSLWRTRLRERESLGHGARKLFVQRKNTLFAQYWRSKCLKDHRHILDSFSWETCRLPKRAADTTILGTEGRLSLLIRLKVSQWVVFQPKLYHFASKTRMRNHSAK